jgi:UDP-N-acetylmuramoyl-L-alanyl-D-glutamate--2,6-diaminopimelate ligase
MKLCFQIRSFFVPNFYFLHIVGVGRVFVQLVDLLKDWPCIVKGSIQINIESITEIIDDVRKNTLFFARKGSMQNNLDYVEDVLEKGATCIVVEDEQFFRKFTCEATIVWVPNILKMMAYTAAAFYQFPSEALKVIAVTGTNGKTTVTHFIDQLLRKLNKKTLLIGTNGLFENGEKVNNGSLTTLPALSFQKLLFEAAEKNIEYCITEASSQGLATYRLDYTTVSVGAFLNLGEDHLDWHGSTENYKQAKLKLTSLSDTLVVNEGDPFCRAIGVISKKETIFYGNNPKCTVFYDVINSSPQAVSYLIQYKEERVVCTFPFREYYNIENALAAISVCLKMGFSLKELADCCQFLKLPEGRAQTFSHPQGFTVVIDYAHTPEALFSLLKAMKDTNPGKIILVFSCGGNRDQGKRKKMGAVASEYADIIVLTSDNSRDEDPEKINEQIITGFRDLQLYDIQIDRTTAIKQAFTYASQGDIVVVAGKGHESTQTVNNKTHYFKDAEVVQSLLEKEEST